jgi:hypothetical protein
MPSRTRLVVPLILFLALTLLSSPHASHATSSPPTPPTDETVFATTHEDDDILRIDFGAGTARTIIDSHDSSGQERKFRGLAVKKEGSAIQVIAANKAQGGNLLIFDGQGSDGHPPGKLVASFADPTAVALDTGSNLFAVNAGGHTLILVPRKPGCPTALDQTPPSGCRAGGFSDSPVVINDGIPGTLADVKFVPVSADADFAPGKRLEGGDVVVLARAPALLVRFGKDGVAQKKLNPGLPDVAFDVVLQTADFGGEEPKGLALTPEGDFLVTTASGKVLRYSAAGAALPSFASGLPGSGEDIAIGLQGGVPKAFVVVGSSGSGWVKRFDLSGKLEKAVSVDDRPHGVGNASLSAAVLTPTGSNRSVTPAFGHDVLFEKVTTAGITSSNVVLVPETEDHVLHVPGQPDKIVPPHFHGFELNGVPTFLVSVVNTRTQFANTLQHHIEEDDYGFETSCENPSFKQPRTFYGTDADDPAIVEGASLTDISTGCASNIGRGGQTSVIVTGWDDRNPSDTAAEKLGQLKAALEGTNASSGGLGGYISKSTRKKLSRELNDAKKYFDRGKTAKALSELQEFVDIVRCNPGAFDNSKRNVSGELLARGDSAYFMVCGAWVPQCNRKLPAPAPHCGGDDDDDDN